MKLLQDLDLGNDKLMTTYLLILKLIFDCSKKMEPFDSKSRIPKSKGLYLFERPVLEGLSKPLEVILGG